MNTPQHIIARHAAETLRLADFLRANCPRVRHISVRRTVLQVLKKHSLIAVQHGFIINGDDVRFGGFDVKAAP